MPLLQLAVGDGLADPVAMVGSVGSLFQGKSRFPPGSFARVGQLQGTRHAVSSLITAVSPQGVGTYPSAG